MKKFNPEMKVVRFGNEDVIVTSGAVTKSVVAAGFGDGIAGNATFSYNGASYNIGTDISSQDFLKLVGIFNAQKLV